MNTQKSAHRRQPQLHRLVHFVSEINAFILFYFYFAHHTYLFIHRFISLAVYQSDLSVYQLDLSVYQSDLSVYQSDLSVYQLDLFFMFIY